MISRFFAGVIGRNSDTGSMNLDLVDFGHLAAHLSMLIVSGLVTVVATYAGTIDQSSPNGMLLFAGISFALVTVRRWLASDKPPPPPVPTPPANDPSAPSPNGPHFGG